MSCTRTYKAPIYGLSILLAIAGGTASFSLHAATEEPYSNATTINYGPDWVGQSGADAEGAPNDVCASSTSSVQTWIEFGFPAITLGAGEVVTGIEVSVKHQINAGTPVRLIVGGSLDGDTGRTVPLHFPGGSNTPNCTNTVFKSVGGASDLWGLAAGTLKTQLASGGVGFRLTSPSASAENYFGLFIDSVKLIVHYAGANTPPTAVCQNVTVPANASCQASVTAAQVNNGSSDPDQADNTLSLELSPSGPYSLGPNPVTLTVTDASSATDACSATITVEDKTAPVINLGGANPLLLECALETYTDPQATVTDNCDATKTINGAGSVLIGAPGDYPVTYNTTDAAGNSASQVVRMVRVQDTTPPVITLNGQNPMTLECAVDGYAEPGATAADACDASVLVTIGGDTVDAGSPGTYNVEYDARDDSNNPATQVIRAVTVEDTLPPVISCNAPDTIIPPDAPISFTATAADACEGQVPASIGEYDCYWTNPSGKLVDKTNSCVVSFVDDTLTVDDSGGVKDTIEWKVNAADSVPNAAAEETCSVLVVKPNGKKPK